jgi:formate dehydrogenase maturation protein FdhE
MAETTANNVDQIRDLIFGSQIKEFEARFAQMEKNIAETERALQKQINDVSAKIQRETERALEVLEKKIDNLTVSTQKERNKLRELIDTTDEALQSQLTAQKDEFATKLKVLKESMEDEQRKLSEEMETMRRELEAHLNENITALGDDKLSRDMMAQMLLDVAMRIQGTDMSAVLSEGAKAENAKK